MKTIKLGLIVLDINRTGHPFCARRQSDPVGQSSLHPLVEAALLESEDILSYTADTWADDAGDPEELNFDAD